MVTQSDNASNTAPLAAPTNGHPIPTPDEDGAYTCDICHSKIHIGCGGSKNFLQYQNLPACLRVAGQKGTGKGTAQSKAMKTINSYFLSTMHGGTSSGQTGVQKAVLNMVTPKLTPRAKAKAAPDSGPLPPNPSQQCKHLDEHRMAVPRPPEHPKQAPTLHALALLASITDAAHDLPSLVPEAEEDDDIAHVVLSGGPKDPSEAWEHFDHVLNRFLGFGVDIEDLAQRIRRGPFGIEGLIRYIHGFMADYSIPGDLLEGKLERLSKALDLVKQ